MTGKGRWIGSGVYFNTLIVSGTARLLVLFFSPTEAFGGVQRSAAGVRM